MAVKITPFWHRIPHFFQYPFRKPSLWVLLGGTGLGVVFSMIPILGPLAMLALSLGIMKYAYEVLAETAEGYMDPPEISSDRSGTGIVIPLKQFAIYFLLGLLVVLIAQGFGAVAALLFAIVALILLPASIITLATTASLTAAINPLLLGQMIQRIGAPYAALYGMLVLLYVGSGAVGALLAGSVPALLLYVVSLFAGYYFTFVMFHLMGYVVYQFHVELDFLPEAVIEAGDGQSMDDELQLFEQFLAEEKYGAAKAELLAVIARHPERLELKQRLHRIAQLSGDRPLLARNGRQLISEYLDAQRLRDAVNVHLDCVRDDPAFRPGRGEDYAPLAQALRERGDGKLAVQLVNGFHKRYPEHPATPSLYVLAARVFSEDLERDDQARVILDYVVKHFPRNPDTRQAKALISALNG
ncbi:hypothetical protein H0Z60_06220 [Ectothiorhodospiraceae bacterium WFHF3C12]|nr:hypothetical protein [Ectothiorhodospiraceae bacterium WFHF3C12]